MIIDNYNSKSVVWIAEKQLTHKETDTTWKSLIILYFCHFTNSYLGRRAYQANKTLYFHGIQRRVNFLNVLKFRRSIKHSLSAQFTNTSVNAGPNKCRKRARVESA
jgi:hypothetical protein